MIHPPVTAERESMALAAMRDLIDVAQEQIGSQILMGAATITHITQSPANVRVRLFAALQ